MDRLAAMQVFVRVAEAGNFAAVAAQMGVARSAVTRQIAALEAHLGVKLMARNTRRLSLTTAGAAYLDQCRDILGRIDAAEGDLVGDGQILRGRIRATLPLSFGLHHLTPLIIEFSQTHPDIHFDLDFNDRRVDLIEEGLDLGLRISDSLADTTVARRLSVCRFAVVASPVYLKRHGIPKHPDDLVRHACFAYSLSPRGGWNFIIDGKLRTVDIGGPLTANNGDVLLAAAKRGLGISYQPTFVVADAIRDGSLVPVLTKFACPEMAMFAVFPGHRYVPRRVTAFVDFLASRLGPDPYWDKDLKLE